MNIEEVPSQATSQSVIANEVIQAIVQGENSDHSRLYNLQKMQQKKQHILLFSLNRKLQKLSIYSRCQVENCECAGHKKLEKVELTFDMLCKCGHTLDMHICHLRNKSEEVINCLMGMAIDIDNIYSSILREENNEAKKVYMHLFKILKEAMRTFSKPHIEGPLGQPPFERPTIQKAVTNLLVYKYSHIGQELKTMDELVEILFQCLNNWDFPAPSSQKYMINPEEATSYKIEYMRWLVFCRIPTFCDSLTRYNTTESFGRTLLKAIFKYIRKEIMDQFYSEKDKMTPERKTMLLNNFPPFLNQLEEEIYSPNSPIWDINFKAQPIVFPLESVKGNRGMLVPRKGEFEKLVGDTSDKEGFTAVTVTSGKTIRISDGGPRETKRKKHAHDDAFEDIPLDTVKQIMKNIDDPNYNTRPEVKTTYKLWRTIRSEHQKKRTVVRWRCDQQRLNLSQCSYEKIKFSDL